MSEMELERSLRRGVAWLIGAQADDGGWHSETYGALRGGAATTSVVLYALAQLPAAIRGDLADAARDAGRFLRPGLDKRRTVCCPDGSLDYPVYAAAQTLIAARSLPLGLSAADQTALEHYLFDAQLLASQGFRAEDKHFGGWDLAGALPGSRQSTGSNVSYVRFAVEALFPPTPEKPVADEPSRAEAPREGRRGTAREAALAWLDRCQASTGDGGFAFSPDPSSLDNKAEWSDAERLRPRAYATATSDGLRALRACGLDVEGKPVRAAATWLDRRWNLDRIPGLPAGDDGDAWSAGMTFYFAESVSGALPTFSSAEELVSRRAELARRLVAAQRGDGSWRNASARMREDDPLIATSLAVAALARCLAT